MTNRDFGVETTRAAIFDVSLAARNDGGAPPERFAADYLRRVQDLPGVEVAAMASRRPLRGGTNSDFTIVDRPEAAAGGLLEIRDVTPGYFDALGIPLRSGRLPDASDARMTRIVVNETFERRYFPNGGAVGASVIPGSQDRTYEVIGVVGDLLEFSPSSDARPTAYFPYGLGPYGTPTTLTVIVRAHPSRLSGTVAPARELLREMDAGLAPTDIITLEALVQTLAGQDRLAVRALLLLASSVAVGLTLIGVYGLVSYSVTRRAREIGIRRALGAGRGGVVGLLMREGLAAAAPGLAIGLLLSVMAGRLVASYLFGVEPADPGTFMSAVAVLIAALSLACWIPARRAARIEPVEALRRA